MNNIKVSVIIPYFKKRKYIKNTLRSVINQSYKSFEVIIIYDDNDKNDLLYVKKLVKTDKRIKLLVNKKNLGAGRSRNIGIANAKGSYICFLDADDIWKKNKLLTQLNFMTKNNHLISHTSYEIIKKNKVLEKRIARNFLNFKSLLKSCDIGLSTVMISKKVFKKNIKFSNLKTKEDFILWLEILKLNYVIYGLDKVLVRWQKTEGSLSSSIIQKLSDSYVVYNKFIKFNPVKSVYYTLLLSINFLKKKLVR